MTTMHLDETVATKICHSCIAEVPATDNFCRKCGVLQRSHPNTAETWQNSTTRRVPANEVMYRSLSKPLINHLTDAVTMRAAGLRGNQSGMRLIAVLITIPIWLLIILLSPLDAYTTARAVSRQMDYQ